MVTRRRHRRPDRARGGEDEARPGPSLRRRIALVEGLAARNLIQPATALWRVYEIEAIGRHVRFEGRVLDLGCGDGSLTDLVLEKAALEGLVGVEPDASDAAAARRTGRFDRVHQAAGEAIPEPSGAFDVVFSNSVLEHIPAVEPVLAEVGRVLRPGGRLVFTVPSDRFHECLGSPGVIERLLAPRGEPVGSRIDLRLKHYRYWSPDQWRDALGAAGLRFVRAHRYFPAPAVRSWQRLSSLTGGVVFELLGRRLPTRAAQRRLGLDRLEPIVPAGVKRSLLRLILARHLGAEIDDGPSGGLLVVATRAA